MTARAGQLHDLVTHHNELRVYPDMRFSCDVMIHSVTILGYNTNTGNVPPGLGIELELWKTYSIPIPNGGIPVPPPSSCMQYEPPVEVLFPPFPPRVLATSARDIKKLVFTNIIPLHVKSGSILAIHQLAQEESYHVLLHQEGGGPLASHNGL